MACRSHDKAEAAMAEIRSSGIQSNLTTVQLDVTDERSIGEAAAHGQQHFGRLDVLVNNAGVSRWSGDGIKAQFQLCLRPMSRAQVEQLRTYFEGPADALASISVNTGYPLEKSIGFVVDLK